MDVVIIFITNKFMPKNKSSSRVQWMLQAYALNNDKHWQIGFLDGILIFAVKKHDPLDIQNKNETQNSLVIYNLYITTEFDLVLPGV